MARGVPASRAGSFCSSPLATAIKRSGMWCAWCDFLPVCLRELKVTETLVRVSGLTVSKPLWTKARLFLLSRIVSIDILLKLILHPV